MHGDIMRSRALEVEVPGANDGAIVRTDAPGRLNREDVRYCCSFTPPPSGSWKVIRINWSHAAPDLLLDVDICVPTAEPRTCSETGHIVRMSFDDGRVLAQGRGSAVSLNVKPTGCPTTGTAATEGSEKPY